MCGAGKTSTRDIKLQRPRIRKLAGDVWLIAADLFANESRCRQQDAVWCVLQDDLCNSAFPCDLQSIYRAGALGLGPGPKQIRYQVQQPAYLDRLEHY